MVGKYGKERRTRFYLIRPSSAQAGIFYPGPVSPVLGSKKLATQAVLMVLVSRESSQAIHQSQGYES
jgi:hypothetical protein